MKDLLVNYIRMLKAGFFNKTIFMPILLLLPGLTNTLGIRGEFLVGLLIGMGGWAVLFFILSEVSEKRYALYSALPIKIKDAIAVTYIHTYIIYILSFIGTLCAALLSETELPMLSLVSFTVFIFCSNIFYPYFATTELKSGANQQDKALVWVIILVSTMMVGGIFIFVLSDVISTSIILSIQISIMIIMILLSIITAKRSYKATVEKVMGV